MFKEIPGGKQIQIQGPEAPFDIWLPPPGYGCHADTGEVGVTDIIKRSDRKSEQYWQRPELPTWWASRLEKEQQQQLKDRSHSDAGLDAIRAREWRRRLFGVWFWNHGELTYITGQHYMLLTYWKFQGKWFDYRRPNREYYYVLAYCIEDPNCLGLIEVTKRKEGKTARGGLFVYDYISRHESRHGGIQSKTDADAAEVFAKAIVTPWRKLPEFFQPIFDRRGGDNPSGELRFFNTSQRSRVKVEEDDALESWIDYKPALPEAYDGPELHRYLSDEAGKLRKHSITDRHDVVMFCSEVDGEYVGKHLYTTTVEEMESGGSDFLELVKRSNRLERSENGRTKTGLYVYFLPADHTLYYDQFGEPDVTKGRLFHMNRRKALQNLPRALSSYIRKNPFTLQEAFRVDGDKCLYNAELLNNQLDRLSWATNTVERGNFVWKNGERDTEVVWVKDKQGKWEVAWLFDEAGASNKIGRLGNYFRPNNTTKFVGGADTFSHDVVKDYRRSDGALLIKKKHDPGDAAHPYDDAFVCLYKHRAASTAIQYEDMLKTAVYFGCQILFESNKNAWKDYFVSRGYEGFLMKLRGYPDYGIPGNQKTHQHLAESTEDYIESNSEKVWFKDVVTDWLEFDLSNTTRFDVAMAAGYTLIADNRLIGNRVEATLPNITTLFRKRKIA